MTSLPPAAWVTHADARFLPLAEVLIEGLAAFSRLPVVLYAVDCEPRIAAPGVVVRRLASGGRHVAYLKFDAILDALDSGLERGVYLDADHVPTPAIDRMFEIAGELAGEVGETLLCPRHPRDLGEEVNGPLMAELGVVAKSMPYVHTCVLGVAPSCRPFLAECDAVARDCERRGFPVPVVDETIVNVLLWKWKATRQIPSVNLPHRLFESWRDGTLADHPDFQERYAGHPWEALAFHYGKDPARARAILAGMVGP
jgi:hypothetical protein